jgi:hypothetical protein
MLSVHYYDPLCHSSFVTPRLSLPTAQSMRDWEQLNYGEMRKQNLEISARMDRACGRNAHINRHDYMDRMHIRFYKKYYRIIRKIIPYGIWALRPSTRAIRALNSKLQGLS